MQGSYLSTGGERADAWAWLSRGESFELHVRCRSFTRSALMGMLGGRCATGSGQRALLPMSTRRGLIARLPYSNSYPARHLLANKKGDAWQHVIGK